MFHARIGAHLANKQTHNRLRLTLLRQRGVTFFTGFLLIEMKGITLWALNRCWMWRFAPPAVRITDNTVHTTPSGLLPDEGNVAISNFFLHFVPLCRRYLIAR